MTPEAVVGGAILTVGGKVTQELSGGVFDTRLMGMFGNTKSPSVLPSADALINAYNHGYITDMRLLFEAFVSQGILPNRAANKASYNDWGDAWFAVRQSTLAKPADMEVFRAVLYGHIADANVDEVNKRYKFDEKCQFFTDMYRVFPSMPEVIAAKQKGIITQTNVINDLYRKAGAPNTKTISLLEEVHMNRLTAADITRLFWRGYLDHQQWTQSTQLSTGFDVNNLKGLEVLSEQIPGPSDLVQFAIRDAFNEEIVADLGLDEEFDQTPQYQYWMSAQGVGISRGYGPVGFGELAYWPKMYWRASRALMPLETAYKALQRLRPGRLGMYSANVPGLQAFTYSDLNLLFRHNHYVPKQRQWLAALAYSIPNRRQLSMLFALGTINEEQLYQYLLDNGYTQTAADELLKLEKIRAPYTKKKYDVPPLDTYDRGLYASVLDAFRAGSINVDTLQSALLSILVNPQVVSRVIQAETIKQNNTQIKAFATMVRSSFFTGEISANTARDTLTSGGIVQQTAQRLVNLWMVKLDLPRKVVSAGKLVDWFRHGAITINGLADRLQRLGYSSDTILLTIAEGERLIAEDLAKKKLAEIRAAKQAAKEAAAEHAKQVAAENKFRTMAVVKRWLTKGIIDSGTAHNMLVEMEVPQTDIDKWQLDLGVA